MMYDNNVDFGLVAVEDVADGVYKAATTKKIHGKNYLLSSESYHVSDISLMLNNQAPESNPHTVYRNDLAKKELGIDFKPAHVPLNNYSN